MTIRKVREILGLEIEDLSDDEVQIMIDRDFMLCDALLDVIMVTPHNDNTAKHVDKL